ncbi:MAG: type II toxin-antitoxin system prevent-host-death family antitoxin [Deltaproteobacteria bacterium]|nr:type II toxin-antitoxin system prevent-host-death family antitoxin [Deltaproteobacteria bacterium]
MRTVGLKVLKNRLSEYVRAAEAGETVLISDRDRVVAELVPPSDARAPRVADVLLAELVRSGLLTPALRPPGRPPATEPVASWAELAAELAAQRADR